MRMKKRVWKKRIRRAQRDGVVAAFRIPKPVNSVFCVYAVESALYLGVPVLGLAVALDGAGDLNRIWGGAAASLWTRADRCRVPISDRIMSADVGVGLGGGGRSL